MDLKEFKDLDVEEEIMSAFVVPLPHVMECIIHTVFCELI